MAGGCGGLACACTLSLSPSSCFSCATTVSAELGFTRDLLLVTRLIEIETLTTVTTRSDIRPLAKHRHTRNTKDDIIG